MARSRRKGLAGSRPLLARKERGAFPFARPPFREDQRAWRDRLARSGSYLKVRDSPLRPFIHAAASIVGFPGGWMTSNSIDPGSKDAMTCVPSNATCPGVPNIWEGRALCTRRGPLAVSIHSMGLG